MITVSKNHLVLDFFHFKTSSSQMVWSEKQKIHNGKRAAFIGIFIRGDKVYEIFHSIPGEAPFFDSSCKALGNYHICRGEQKSDSDSKRPTISAGDEKGA